MSEIEELTENERELLLSQLGRGTSHLDDGTLVANGDVVQKALLILDAQAAHIEELESASIEDEVEIRQLKSKRFAPAERAVLDACAEMMLVPEENRVRVPNIRDIELVAEAEWAKRQEHGIADREEGIDIVEAPAAAARAGRPRPTLSRIRRLEVRSAELEERVTKARRRIAELEAQVLASETVSKAEYATMVAQRDTLREDRKAARILLEDALGWLRAHATSMPGDVPEELTWLIGDIAKLPPIRI